MSCTFMASCQKPAIDETTASSDTESAKEDDGISVGDHIVFGNYQQKNVPGTDTYGTEPIEWRVLEIRDGNALVISEYLLDTAVYYYDMADVTWETSSLRK